MEINGQTLRNMLISATNSLDNNKVDVNNMNVFPVPDGDTGINMTLTMSTVRALSNFDGTVSDCAQKVADMVLRSARGNSGAILSLFFRGMAKELKGLETATPADVARAMKRGTAEAYKAVMQPTEGTILTVMRVCSEKAEEAAKDKYKDDIVGLFTYIKETGEETLARTPELLPVLREAQVVDAGGFGFMLLITGMLAALKQQPIEANEETITEQKSASFSEFDASAITFTYCTECIVAKKKKYRGEGTAAEFNDFACAMGDSVVFVDDEEIIKIHVHTNHPGQIIEKALEYGEIESMKVENMKLQHSTMASSEKKEATPVVPVSPAEEAVVEVAPPEKPFGTVSICMGEGIRDTFIDLGVDRIVFGGQTMNPSTQDIINAVKRTPADNVYVLPNNKNIYLVAVQAAKLVEEKNVIVLPTKSVPQGIAAMIAFNPDGDLETNTAEMNDAISNVRTAQVTYAVRDTSIEGVQIKDGQLIAIVDGKIICAADDAFECINAIADVFSDASFLTVFYGENIKDEEAEKALGILQSKIADDADISLINGGQPVYDYIIAAE